MVISDLELFVKIYEMGFDKACSILRFSRNDALQSLNGLNDYLGFKLFFQNTIPSRNSLTECGKTFLPYAISITNQTIKGILEVCEKVTPLDKLIIRSSFGYGKTILLPSIHAAVDSNILQDIKLDIITYENIPNIDLINTHILFHPMSKIDNVFFDKKWSVCLKQGLYASKDYLLDIGSIPKQPEDLKMHSIIAYGECFDFDSYKISNWHLSGEYGLCELETSILINSKTVLIAAVEANLGIGPVIDCHENLGYKKLHRILPDISGPNIILDFAVRKNLPAKSVEQAIKIEIALRDTLTDMGLEIY